MGMLNGFKLLPVANTPRLGRMNAAGAVGKGLFNIGKKFRAAKTAALYKPAGRFAGAIANGAISIGKMLAE